MEVKKYVNMPIEAEVLQFTGNNLEDVSSWTGGRVYWCLDEDGGVYLRMGVLAGDFRLYPGVYLVKEFFGDHYEVTPIKKEIFEKKYKEIVG